MEIDVSWVNRAISRSQTRVMGTPIPDIHRRAGPALTLKASPARMYCTGAGARRYPRRGSIRVCRRDVMPQTAEPSLTPPRLKGAPCVGAGRIWWMCEQVSAGRGG